LPFFQKKKNLLFLKKKKQKDFYFFFRGSGRLGWRTSDGAGWAGGTVADRKAEEFGRKRHRVIAAT
jgi:hypothetical protein